MDNLRQSGGKENTLRVPLLRFNKERAPASAPQNRCADLERTPLILWKEAIPRYGISEQTTSI